MASDVSLERNWEMINGSDQYSGSTTIDQNNLRSSSGNPFCHNSTTEITNPDYNNHSFPNNYSTNIISFGNLSSATSVSPPPHDHHVMTTSSSRGEMRFQMQQPQNFPVSDTQQLYAYEESVKGSTSSSRTSLEAQYHVMAERKRREKLSQLFLSLSTMIPGLKKVNIYIYIYISSSLDYIYKYFSQNFIYYSLNFHRWILLKLIKLEENLSRKLKFIGKYITKS